MRAQAFFRARGIAKQLVFQRRARTLMEAGGTSCSIFDE